MNISNYGVIEGRLAKDPKVFTNSDGSRKVMITVAAQRNYKNKDGQRETDFIQLEHYLPATKEGNGAYDILKKGDTAAFQYTVRPNNYEDANGNMHYGQCLLIEQTQIRSTKNSVQKGAAAAQGTPVTPDMPAAADEDDVPFTE